RAALLFWDQIACFVKRDCALQPAVFLVDTELASVKSDPLCPILDRLLFGCKRRPHTLPFIRLPLAQTPELDGDHGVGRCHNSPSSVSSPPTNGIFVMLNSFFLFTFPRFPTPRSA